VFVDQRQRAASASSPGKRARTVLQMALVDLEDDLQVARQQRSNSRTGQVSSASGISVWLV
jgi:hypothetical protein